MNAIPNTIYRFSALQRAEIAEIQTLHINDTARLRFSALQRAEIAEIGAMLRGRVTMSIIVSVLFNEPKLLKFG